MGNPKKPGDPNVTSSAGVVPKKPGAQDQQGTNLSPVVKPPDRQGPLDSADPMAQLQSKYPGRPGQPGLNLPPVSKQPGQPVQQDPNAWSWRPNGKDYAYGGVGAGLTAIDKVHKATQDPTNATEIRQKLGDFQSRATRMQGLADSASDPALRATLLKEARAADRGAAYQKIGLQTLTGPAKVADKISDPQSAERQLGKLGQKGLNAGVNAARTVSDVGNKVEDLSPKAAKFGQKLANGGINTGLAAGKVGEGLESLGPNAGKLGQKVAAAGVNAGAKAVDLGGNLGPNVEKLGQKLAAAGVSAGGKAVAAGQDLAQTAKVLAPRLAQAGEYAGKAGEFVAKRAPILGLAATGIQAYTDLAGGKSKGRVAAETAGSLIGGSAGTWLGGILGSAIPVPVVGTAVGAAVGNLVGSYVGGRLGDLFADKMDGARGRDH
jgi:hypothetical protein